MIDKEGLRDRILEFLDENQIGYSEGEVEYAMDECEQELELAYESAMDKVMDDMGWEYL